MKLPRIQTALHFLVCARKVHTSAAQQCSALFVTSLRANKTTAILQPNIDYKNKFKDLESLKKMLAVRGHDGSNLDKMKETLDFIESIKTTRQTLEQQRVASTKELSQLYKNEAENESVIKPLKAVSKMLRENLKNMSKEIASLEEKVVLNYLNLPNDIHPSTPLENKIISQKESSEMHPNLSKFANTSVQQKESARVELELFLSSFCSDVFQDYVKSSNCDFVKSVVVEGVGMKHRDADSVFILQSEEADSEDANLHLVGGASLPSFCALFAKTLTPIEKLPIKMITIGRHYSPEGNKLPVVDCQSIAAEIFAVTENNPDKEYEMYLQILSDVNLFYNRLGVSYRLVAKCGGELKNWEALSTSIEVFSVSTGDFAPVGSICFSGSFISNRLLMKYKCSKTKSDFLSVFSGTLVDFKKLEACISTV